MKRASVVKRQLRSKLRQQPKIKRRRVRISQTVLRFSVIGDSHVGYGNSENIFRRLLPRAIRSNTRLVIFGGDNAHAGADHGQFAQARYISFRDTVNSVLGPRNIPYKASIGNWETTTRSLFRNYLGTEYGFRSFPGTQGRVRHIWLDNATGRFSSDSLNLLRSLDDSRYYYIFDFHWPLNISGLTVDPSHVLSPAETRRFFDAVPNSIRNNVLAIFTHHAHLFFQKTSNVWPGFPNTKFFVTGCSGAYECRDRDRGYYDAALLIDNNRYSVQARAVNA
ncbi:metallophosphoesterase family protein [Paenibacillus daejeonensis]|uniref:metallophosphoesterase family protein n=1 Tax=Paenibacillus daejeonensis TaxID=135193 RepID=UPI0003783982|nr:metallophosphoesterase [Paenibacillus daejeonensis]